MSTKTVEGATRPDVPVTEPVTTVGAMAAPPPPDASGPVDPVDPSDPGDDGDHSKLALVLVLVAALIVCGLVALVVFRSHGRHHTASAASANVGVGSANASTTVSVAISATSLVNPAVSGAGSVVGSQPILTPTSAVPATTVAPTTTVSSAVAFTSASASPSSVSCPDPEASTTTTAFVQPDVHLTWTALHATSVDLSVDGPGVYQSGLPASGSYDFSFSCDGPHTLLLTAHGAGGTTATRTFVITSHQ